ncbi:hypothetical protein KFK09_025827 [Dendrobium nobile]|uniref:Uncharacterized protein n=1 Tax=Dendrobium nobile TaxID=94219 RepID=A0A8T3A4W4_DENNO|nr:hypothetical protein KFK09_025827 [Dendrobium nobile]
MIVHFFLGYQVSLPSSTTSLVSGPSLPQLLARTPPRCISSLHNTPIFQKLNYSSNLFFFFSGK